MHLGAAHRNNNCHNIARLRCDAPPLCAGQAFLPLIPLVYKDNWCAAPQPKIRDDSCESGAKAPLKAAGRHYTI